MNITEVRIFQKESDDKKLRAFATVTFDHSFVVRDVKVIEGSKGLFVAMPSRRIKDPCPRCRHRNVVRSRYCNQCGTNLEGVSGHQRQAPDAYSSPGQQMQGRQNDHRDIAHPITAEFRETIQKAVLQAFEGNRVTTSEARVSSGRAG